MKQSWTCLHKGLYCVCFSWCGINIYSCLCVIVIGVFSDPSLQDWPATSGKASGQRDHRPVPSDCHSLWRQPWRGEAQLSLLNHWPDSSQLTIFQTFWTQWAQIRAPHTSLFARISSEIWLSEPAGFIGLEVSLIPCGFVRYSNNLQ